MLRQRTVLAVNEASSVPLAKRFERSLAVKGRVGSDGVRSGACVVEPVEIQLIRKKFALRIK